MARGKRKIGMDVIHQQIEEAQGEVIRAKRKYDEATDRLKTLLGKEKRITDGGTYVGSHEEQTF